MTIPHILEYSANDEKVGSVQLSQSELACAISKVSGTIKINETTYLCENGLGVINPTLNLDRSSEDANWEECSLRLIAYDNDRLVKLAHEAGVRFVPGQVRSY